jgi:two-component system, NarL family, invasion response regulator UvrY
MHQRALKSNVYIMKGDMRNKDTIARILIADSNSLFREKMKQIITDNFEFTLTSEACSEDDVLNELSEYVFDVLILDTELSDGNGLDALKKIKISAPDIPVLIMSMFPVEQYEESVFRAGAHGYVSKVNLSNELITALHHIFQGKKYFSSQGIGNDSEKSYDQRDCSNSTI